MQTLAHAAPAMTTSWNLYPFTGIGTDGGIQHIPFLQADFVPSYIFGLALGRDLGSLWHSALSFEAEVQGATHSGRQSNHEANIVLIARWRQFPWNDHLRTSLAIGEGISYASHIPAIERERADRHSRLLNYILYELELAPPNAPRLSLATRIHHRSGVRGLYNGASKGSNFVTTGIRYRF